MAISNVKKFITKIQSDSNFRESMYKFKNPSEIYTYLNSQGLGFTEDEFEDSYRNLLLKCQFEEEVDVLNDAINMCRFILFV